MSNCSIIFKISYMDFLLTSTATQYNGNCWSLLTNLFSNYYCSNCCSSWWLTIIAIVCKDLQVNCVATAQADKSQVVAQKRNLEYMISNKFDLCIWGHVSMVAKPLILCFEFIDFEDPSFVTGEETLCVLETDVHINPWWLCLLFSGCCNKYWWWRVQFPLSFGIMKFMMLHFQHPSYWGMQSELWSIMKAGI